MSVGKAHLENLDNLNSLSLRRLEARRLADYRDDLPWNRANKIDWEPGCEILPSNQLLINFEMS